MRFILVAVLAAVTLSACADLTPEQRARMAAMADRLNASGAAYQAQQAAADQAYAQAAHQNQPVNCLTSYTQDAAYTHCQ
jgi:hypothetical protein